MKRSLAAALVVVASAIVAMAPGYLRAQTSAREVPRFQVDPAWPKIPNNWQFGQVASVSIDAQDHVWVLQRPGTVEPHEKPRAAPPLLEFDAAGNFIQAWGGPGQGYDWPTIGARRLRRSEGLRLDRRQRRQGPSDAEVHEGRKVRHADRPARAEQGQRRHAEPEPAGRHVRVREDERALRRRRLRQPPRHRVRRRHRQVQADVGRVRQRADRRRAQPRVCRTRTRKARRSSCSRCTPRACRTTGSSTSRIAAASGCRCSRSTAST